MKRSMTICAVTMLLAMASNAMSATVVVTGISTGSKVADKWYTNGTAGSGVASIVELTGLGGNLENNQPSPLGAAKLTTTLSNTSKAEIGTFQNFGNAATVLSNIVLEYSYYRENLTGGNTFAAPSIKLQITASFSDTGNFSDNAGYLVYEPYWNGSVASGNWNTVSINSSTGSGAEGSGGWWWDGGFNIASGSAGPPIRSLSEWVAAFQAADAADFAKAKVTALSVGIGTYNQGTIGYFDNVSIKTGDIDTTYNFAQVPEPATMSLLALGGLALIRRRNRK